MTEKKLLSTVTKTLIKNVIRHTDSHNKVVEETDMWRQREKELHNENNSHSSSYSFLKDRGTDMRYEFMDRRKRSAHMDEEPQSTFWMKKLYKAEESDSNRWGHSGYKELYPEHFSSEVSNSEDEVSQKYRDRDKKKEKEKRKKSRKRRHSDSESDSEKDVKRRKKHKHKEKKKRKHKKKKKKRQDNDSDSDS